jgi:hypothetical protein
MHDPTVDRLAWLMPKRLLIAVAVTAALIMAAVVIFEFFAVESADQSAPPAHVEPEPPPPAPTAPANP